MNADETNEHRGGTAKKEGKGCVWETDESVVVFPGQIDHAHNTDRHEEHQHSYVGVLFGDKNERTLIKDVIFINPKEKKATRRTT